MLADLTLRHQPYALALLMRWVMVLPLSCGIASCNAAGYLCAPRHHSMSSAGQPAPLPVPPPMLVSNAPSCTAATVGCCSSPPLHLLLCCQCLAHSCRWPCSHAERPKAAALLASGAMALQQQWAPSQATASKVGTLGACFADPWHRFAGYAGTVTCRSERLLDADCYVP